MFHRRGPTFRELAKQALSSTERGYDLLYYLTFLLPRAAELLEEHGFRVAIHENVFPRPFQQACVVVATKVGSISE